MKKRLLTSALLTCCAVANAGEFTEAKGPIVQGQYIVTLKEDVSSEETRAARFHDLGVAHGDEGQGRFYSIINGGVVRMTLPQARALAKHPLVAYVEPDTMVWASYAQTPATWGLDRVDQLNLPLDTTYIYNVTGQGVTAYVIDTGILTNHTEFAGRAAVGTDVLGGNGLDCNGHGTHVAGTIGGFTYGLAKNVNLVGVRVLDCNGAGTASGVISGIDWVTKNAKKPAVANMSLGGSANSSLDRAVTNAIRAGISYAVAAGNNSADACNYSPARVSAAVTVGATMSTDARASYSNYGKCLDLFAPGSAITSAWISSPSATNTINGTSMSTPHVTGAMALYLEKYPAASPATVRNALVNAAATNKITAAGTNSPNKLLQSLVP